MRGKKSATVSDKKQILFLISFNAVVDIIYFVNLFFPKINVKYLF